MNQILDLREKRTKAWDAAKASLDNKRGNDGLISGEDVATYEKREADVVARGREIGRLERQATNDRELSLPASAPLTGKPDSPDGVKKQGHQRTSTRNLSSNSYGTYGFDSHMFRSGWAFLCLYTKGQTLRRSGTFNLCETPFICI